MRATGAMEAHMRELLPSIVGHVPGARPHLLCRACERAAAIAATQRLPGSAGASGVRAAPRKGARGCL